MTNNKVNNKRNNNLKDSNKPSKKMKNEPVIPPEQSDSSSDSSTEDDDDENDDEVNDEVNEVNEENKEETNNDLDNSNKISLVYIVLNKLEDDILNFNNDPLQSIIPFSNEENDDDNENADSDKINKDNNEEKNDNYQNDDNIDEYDDLFNINDFLDSIYGDEMNNKEQKNDDDQWEDCNKTIEKKNKNYNLNLNNENDLDNNGSKNTYNFRTNRKQRGPIKRDDQTMDSFFSSLLDKPLKTKRNESNKRKRVYDDFKDYFAESNTLLPINKPVKTLKDLIELGKTYNPYDKNRYVINLRALHKCIKPLEDLDSMIGMKNIKEMIIDLIFFRLQNLEDSQNELWHLVIQGSPGCGKTEVSRIIGKLYYCLGITKKDKFTPVKRSDLIGKYLGHTAKMTQDVFDDARGGILFIDEAYSLGNPEGRDSFSKECIDTINQNLTENRETVVFIAGYKEQLEESFFSYNPGLNRRFKMRMNVDVYNASELREIYLKKLKENKWCVLNDNFEKEIPLSFFEKNIGLFKYNGGDMENLWHFTKIVHARRIFGQSNDIVKKITYQDLENSLKTYNENDEFKNRSDTLAKYIHDTMYC